MQLAQGIGGGMDAGQGGNHPQDARQCSLRMLNGEVRLRPSAIRRQTPTYIQCWTGSVHGSLWCHTGSKLELKLIYYFIWSLGSFKNNTEFKIGPAGLRTSCPSWWCSPDLNRSLLLESDGQGRLPLIMTTDFATEPRWRLSRMDFISRGSA